MTTIVGFVLLAMSLFTFSCGLLFRNEAAYRKFLTGYMKFFGIDATKIPSTAAVPDPLLPHVRQAQVAGYMFIGLSVIIFLAAVYLLSITKSV